jgi:hypothetical protein
LGRLTAKQIDGINDFMRLSFYRFGVASDDRTDHAPELGAHFSTALMLHRFIEKIAARHELGHIAMIFEDSDRGRPLVARDMERVNRGIFDSRGINLSCDVCFLSKAAGDEALEVADVIAHTVGRQQRHWRSARGTFTKDFEAVFHRVDPALVEYVSVAGTKLSSAAAKT